MAGRLTAGGGVTMTGLDGIDLTELNTKTARNIAAQIRRNLTQKRAADGARVPRNADSTEKRKGFNHRNIHTRALYDGITKDSGKWHFEVSVSDSVHPNAGKSGVTIQQVGQFNQKSNANANKKWKKRGSLVNWFGISTVTRDNIVSQYELELFDQMDKNIKISGVVRGTVR